METEATPFFIPKICPHSSTTTSIKIIILKERVNLTIPIMMVSDGLFILSGYAQGHPQNLSVSANRVGVLLGFLWVMETEKKIQVNA